MESETAKEDECWIDITSEFKNHVSQLDLGELLKANHFTLFEAMGAIELMDPKMDSGMILSKCNRPILNLEQSIRQGRIKTNSFEPEELIGIIDETYACLSTWLDGHALAHTVMTNLYLHDTEKIEDKCLRVFCQAILKIIDFVERLLQSVFCFEEDDFILNLGRFNLATHINEQKLLSSLDDLCQTYEKLAHEQQTATTSSSQLNHDEEKKIQGAESSDNHQAKAKKLTAISKRLRFTYNLYACFLNISKNLLKEHTINGPNTVGLIQKTIKLVQSSVMICDQHLDKCLIYLEKWSDTLDLGIKPTDISEITIPDDYQTIMGFEPLIDRNLVPAAYPRRPSMKSRSTMIEYMKELILELRECITLSNHFYHKSFTKSLDVIEYFSKYRQPRSCVVSRSFLQLLYLPNRIVEYCMIKDELSQSMNDYCEPIVQILKKDCAKSETINEFLEESAKIFSQIFLIYSYNTARQHEKLFELILSFKNLQYSAFLVNDIIKNNFVYSWTTFHYAKLCIKYVLASMELELFSPHEYPYVFWYLYDILYRNEKEQLEYAKKLLFESQLALDRSNRTKSNSKKNRKKAQLNTMFHDKNLLLNDALRFLAGGMFLLTYGLKKQGKIRSPSTEYTNEEITFDRRFGSITGAPVFAAYSLTLSRLDKLEAIYKESFDCFSEAKSLFEKYGEGQEDCLTVCKVNMVVAKILSSNMETFSDREVEFCFNRHPSFPTVKL